VPRILVVDDQPAKLVALKTVLSSLGAEVVTAATAEEGLELLLGGDFAVALLDIRMGGLDGYDLASAVLDAKGKAAPAIIFVTAFEQDETDVVRAYSMGAVDYIYSSSMVPEIIRARVAVLLDDWRKRQAEERAPRRRAEPARLHTDRRRLVNLSAAARLVAGSDTTLRRWLHEGWIMNLAPPGAPRKLVDLRDLLLIMGLRFVTKQIDSHLVELLGLPSGEPSPVPDPCLKEARKVAALLHRPEAALAASVGLFHGHGYSCEEISSALRRIGKMLEPLGSGV
jgi:CheY-like chemotaxis protein